MLKKRFRLQFSLRVTLLVMLIACVGVWKFTPQIRAGLVRFTSRVPDSPFTSSPTTVGPRIWSSFQKMHDWYENAFVNSDGFGESRLIRFDDPFRRQIEVNGRLYSVRKLELVSLAKKDLPVAYVNDRGNPVKARYKQGVTRSLTEFENRSLDKLRTGRQFVFNGDAEHPQFLGAIRARAICLACHQAKTGDLLGGFAYELDPIKSVRNEDLKLHLHNPLDHLVSRTD